MNGFHHSWRGIRAHESTRTTGKKRANSTVGKSTAARDARESDSMTGRVGRAILGALLAVLIAVATGAPVASASCGGIQKAHPKRKVAPRAPLAIGDSVMLLALPALARVGYNVDARGCRQFEEGIHLL